MSLLQRCNICTQLPPFDADLSVENGEKRSDVVGDLFLDGGASALSMGDCQVGEHPVPGLKLAFPRPQRKSWRCCAKTDAIRPRGLNPAALPALPVVGGRAFFTSSATPISPSRTCPGYTATLNM